MCFVYVFSNYYHLSSTIYLSSTYHLTIIYLSSMCLSTFI